jgi:hypothetical protein
MSATANCAFCGTETPTAAMDMTGNGWRCASCALRSEIATARGRPAGMGEHLTQSELRGVAAAGANEAVLGVLLAVGGLVGTAMFLAAGGQLIVVFSGAMIGGLSMLGHGLYRRKHALAALRDAPAARVIKG